MGFRISISWDMGPYNYAYKYVYKLYIYIYYYRYNPPIPALWWFYKAPPRYTEVTKRPTTRCLQPTRWPSMICSQEFHYWLVVDLALWKIWVRQLGFLFPYIMERHKSHVPVTTNQLIVNGGYKPTNITGGAPSCSYPACISLFHIVPIWRFFNQQDGPGPWFFGAMEKMAHPFPSNWPLLDPLAGWFAYSHHGNLVIW